MFFTNILNRRTSQLFLDKKYRFKSTKIEFDFVHYPASTRRCFNVLTTSCQRPNNVISTSKQHCVNVQKRYVLLAVGSFAFFLLDYLLLLTSFSLYMRQCYLIRNLKISIWHIPSQPFPLVIFVIQFFCFLKFRCVLIRKLLRI